MTAFARFEPASEHDIMHFEDVLDAANTSRDILADNSYVDGEREATEQTGLAYAHPAQRQQGQAAL